MTEYKNINGVPDFVAEEICAKKSKYCVCIPVINEGERIINELNRAQQNNISNLAHIIGGMVGAIVGYQWNKK